MVNRRNTRGKSNGKKWVLWVIVGVVLIVAPFFIFKKLRTKAKEAIKKVAAKFSKKRQQKQ